MGRRLERKSGCETALVPLLLTGVRHNPPGRTDKNLCRCFGAPAYYLLTALTYYLLTGFSVTAFNSRVTAPRIFGPPAKKLALGAMRGAGVLLVAFLGGASAITGTCMNWYAHPHTCHRPSLGETHSLEALLPVALCPAQRSVPDALALNLYPLPSCLNTPPLHTHVCPPRAPPLVFCFCVELCTACCWRAHSCDFSKCQPAPPVLPQRHSGRTSGHANNIRPPVNRIV